MPLASESAAATQNAARLAAEAAFSNPPVAAQPARPVQIIVRRSRTSSLVAQPAKATHQVPVVETAVKRSRVFRVGTTSTPPADEAMPPDARPVSAPTPNVTSMAKAATASKSRDPGADKRPGPVLRVFQTRLDQPAEVPSNPQRSGSLIAALAPVAPVLELIARAQTFTVIDPTLEVEWLRLSLRLAALHAELQAELR